MPKIEVSIIIKRPQKEVYKTVKDMESFPAFMRDVKNLKIIKHTDNKIVTAWETEIEGAPVAWKEEDSFDEANYQVKFNMVEGHYKEYHGAWIMESHPKGTRLILKANFDWGIPVLEKYVTQALEQKARRGMLGMLQAIKNKTEKANV